LWVHVALTESSHISTATIFILLIRVGKAGWKNKAILVKLTKFWVKWSTTSAQLHLRFSKNEEQSRAELSASCSPLP